VTRATGHTGAVTLVQHFGWTLKLNVHLHMVFVDGVSGTTGGATQPDQNAGSPNAPGGTPLGCPALPPRRRYCRADFGPGYRDDCHAGGDRCTDASRRMPRLAVGRGEEFPQQLVAFREERLREIGRSSADTTSRAESIAGRPMTRAFSDGLRILP